MANPTTRLERASLPADLAPDLRDIFFDERQSESVAYIRSVIARLSSNETRDRIAGLLGKELGRKDELSRSNLIARVAELRSARVELGRGIESITSYFTDGRSKLYTELDEMIRQKVSGLSKDSKGTITDSRLSPWHKLYPKPAAAKKRLDGFMEMARKIDECLSLVDPDGKLTQGAITQKLVARTTSVDASGDTRTHEEREALFARIFTPSEQ